MCEEMVLTKEDSVHGGAFTYQDIKSVNVIVIFEKSTGGFHKTRDAYVHHGKVRFEPNEGRIAGR